MPEPREGKTTPEFHPPVREPAADQIGVASPELQDIGDTKNRDVKPKASRDFEKACRFVTETLLAQGECTKKTFTEPSLLSSSGFHEDEWSRVTSGVIGCLFVQGFKIQKQQKSVVVGKRPSSAFSTSGLRSDLNRDEKKAIGEFVAGYVRNTEQEVFFGTGSTVLNIGKFIVAGGEERYNTINIPLAAEWCSRDVDSDESYASGPAPNKITLWGGVLDTPTYRYRSLLQDKRSFAVTVVGADGCLYSQEAGQLYVKDEEYAKITNDFLRLAAHSVIVCVAAAKMTVEGPGTLEMQRTGALISPPENKNIRRIIVTDKEPGPEIRGAFSKQDWVILTPEMGWPSIDEDGIELSAKGLHHWVGERLNELKNDDKPNRGEVSPRRPR